MKDIYLATVGKEYPSHYIVSNAKSVDDAKLAVLKYRNGYNKIRVEVLRTGAVLPRCEFINANELW